MRVDKFLKISRIIKRRTVAKDAAQGERICANGRVVKPSYDVKVGDVLEVTFGTRTLKVEVLALPTHVTKENAGDMYKVLGE